MHGEQGASRDEQVFKILLEEENYCANSACTTATQMNTKKKTGSPSAQVCPAKLKHSVFLHSALQGNTNVSTEDSHLKLPLCL